MDEFHAKYSTFADSYQVTHSSHHHCIMDTLSLAELRILMNRHSVTLSLVEWEVARIYHLLNRRDASKLEGWQAQCLQMFVVITRGCRFGWKHKCMKLACCLSLDCESVTKETVFHKNWSSSSGGSDNCDSFSRIHCYPAQALPWTSLGQCLGVLALENLLTFQPLLKRMSVSSIGQF